MRRRTLLATAALLPATRAFAQGNDWPNRPIRIVVPFPPGGPNDIIARLYAPALTAVLKQPIVIENRGGAGGGIGVDAVAKSAPDGYSLVISSSGSLVINPHVMNVPYKIPDDFTPISVVTLVPEALVAHPSLGVKTLPELIALAKRQPGRINIGTAGSAGISQLAAELFKAQTGIDITVVPYRGAAPAVVDLLGNSIQLLFADLPVILPHIRSNALVPVVLASRQRSPSLPDLPITAEHGFPQVLADNWYSMLGPAKLPAPILAKLSEAVKIASQTPEVRDGLASQGAQATWTTPADFTARLISESEVWRRVAQAANIRAD
ncbi:MFS transporter [Siccirubricoccus deserti]|uniref:Tripartite tricarboxylate transporter substrate binding protein n=1 Tax=Siccirubricoccus deserti TaxID=2013562 RepID=A0A9X0QY94_9PROT|nr:tripartite tricarboxylate transporter substrate binding protein [Siccirubricoccus deserti]MBC4016214.1 tripartite tricarboxylate transporter substrate binding protein [Siccirubricoccus deserti]GGC48102.1 MFS transporter [Siccirubricoccus deserti]